MTEILLIILVFVLVVVPGFPAFREWRRKQDAEPLPISSSAPQEVLRPWPEQEDVSSADQVIRRLASLGSVRLSGGTRVEESVHANNDLHVSGDVRMCGSASSDCDMWLEPGCSFERIKARVIRIEVPADEAEHELPVPPDGFEQDSLNGDDLVPFEPIANRDFLGTALLIRGDLRIPAGTRVQKSIVVKGSLTLEEGAMITGDVKVSGSVIIGPDAILDGNLTGNGDITFAPKSSARGIVLSQGTLSTANQTVFGSPDQPVTVSGRCVLLATGTKIYGAVIAMESGAAVTTPNSTATLAA